MSDLVKVSIAIVLLIILALLPGIVAGWELVHSMGLMFVLGAVAFWLDRRAP